MNENTNTKPQTTTESQTTHRAEIHEQKPTCKTCLLYQGYKNSCYSDGVKPTDICKRYQPNPVIYL